MANSVTVDWSASACDVRDFISARAGETDASKKFPSENIDYIGKKGLLGLIVPKALGGAEAKAEEFARVVQSIGGACASTGMIYVMHSCAIDAIAHHHSGQEEVLRQAAQGKHLSTLACSEKGSGANFYASDATSSKGDGFAVLEGDKSFVTSGGFADSYIVPTRSFDSKGPIDTTLYLVNKDTTGLSFSGKWQGLGLCANNSVSMRLAKCQVQESATLGAQGKGFEIEMTTILPRFLLGTGAVYNGIASAALQAAIQHLKSRSHTHTSEQLTALPTLRRKVAEMKVAVDSSIALMMSAGRAWDAEGAGAPVLTQLLAVKQLACRTAVDVATLALETSGGIAYSAALPIERHLRDAHAGIVMAPTNDMLLDLIGRAALDMPLM